jgi:preprotein translocase subunit SecG
MLFATLIVFQIISALLLVLFILLHAGRGGGLSDMFGGGSSGLAGGTAVERNLDRITVATAVVFAGTTFYLAWKWV